MAIDLTVQPWIQKMLTPADPAVTGAIAKDFVGGLAGGYLSAKANQRQAAAQAGIPKPPPSGFEQFVRTTFPEEQRTIDETLKIDLNTLGQEIGTLKTSDEILRWVAKNSALAASPIGGRMLDVIYKTGQQMARTEAESLGHITAKKLAEEKAELMLKYGLGPDAKPEQVGTARANENEIKFMEMAAKSLGKDVSGMVTPQDFDSNGNWLPGAQQRILKGAPTSAIARTTAVPDKMEIADDIAKQEAILADPNASPAAKQAAQFKLSGYNAQNPTSSETFRDAQGNVIFERTSGRQPAATGAVTPTNLTKIQASLIEGEKAVADIDSLMGSLRSRDVGIQGVVGEFFDVYGPQFGIAKPDLQRMDNRTAIRSMVESIKRKVTDDDRFTEGDRKAVKEIVISPNINENEDTARQKGATLKRIFGVKALIEAKAIGKPAPAWALRALPAERIIEGATIGQLDDEDVITAYHLGRLSEAQAISARRKSREHKAKLTRPQ